MITITFLLISTATGVKESITVSMNAVPRIHEFVTVSGQLYRVEDITHNVETREIEVRAIA